MLPFYEVRKTDLTVKHNKYEVSFPEHMHKYIEVLYVYSGAQHIKIEDTEYCVKEGEAIVIFPNVIHSFFKAEKEKADELLLMCDPKILNPFFPNFKEYKTNNPIIPKKNINEETLFALRHIKPDDSFEIKFGWICIIFSNIINKLVLSKDSRMPIQDITYKITGYIENNFTEDITRESLAKMFNVSIYCISRVFKDKFKMNLRSYLGLIRAEYAAVLIRTTNRTLTDIALDSGFDSIRTFNRVFKNIYGISPSQFKNNIANFANKSLKN